MRDYRFDFANGTTDLVETMSVRTGYVRFYEVLSGGGLDPRIRVESMGGGWQCVLRPGQGFRLPEEETGGVVVTNMSGVAMAGTLKLGPRNWQFEDQRLTGTVSVVDSNFALTQSGQAFSAYHGYTPAASNFGQIQLLNPAGSGRIIEVQSVLMASSGNVSLVLTTGLTLNNNQSGFYNLKLASNSPFSGLAQIRTQDSLTALQTSRQVAVLLTSTNAQTEKIFRSPIVLNPGDGVMAHSYSTSFIFSAETIERLQV